MEVHHVPPHAHVPPPAARALVAPAPTPTPRQSWRLPPGCGGSGPGAEDQGVGLRPTHMAMGQNSSRLAPGEHPSIHYKLGSKMGGEFNPKRVHTFLQNQPAMPPKTKSLASLRGGEGGGAAAFRPEPRTSQKTPLHSRQNQNPVL